jgi:hypothetical protein
MKTSTITQTNRDGITTEFTIIDWENGGFTSMTTAEYNRQQADQSELK